MTKKQIPSTTTLIAAVAACSVAGFMAGRISSEPSGAAQQAANNANERSSPAGSSRMTNRNGASAGPRAARQSSARERSTSSSSSSSQDPIAQMESIMNNPHPLDRAESWLRFVKGLDSTEIEDVVVGFRSKDMARGNLSEHSLLLNAWANYDPLGALDYASENTSTPFARQTILTSWTSTNPAAAMKWAQDNHEGEGANPWMVAIIRGVASTDPAQATQLMNDMPYSRERAQAFSAVQGHYLKQGPDAARNWASSIQDEQLRAGAIARIAKNLARTDPKGTADWLLANPGDGATRVMGEDMARMAEADPQAAVNYLTSIFEKTPRTIKGWKLNVPSVIPEIGSPPSTER